MFRLRVAEYFDSVVNEIDLFTETKIQSIKTQTEEDWWNKRRQEQIDEVRRIERACLDHVNTLKVEEKEIESGEWMKRAFMEYCFTVDYADLFYLVKANRYVEPKEKRFIDVHLIERDKDVKVAINSHQSLRMTIEEFEMNVRDNFLTDAPIIDISSGLDKCCSIKRARISNDVDPKQSSIYLVLDDFSIEECSLGFCIQNTNKEKKAVDVIKCLMTGHGHINTIKIDLLYVEHEDPSPEIKALAQSVELNDRVKFNFYKKDSSFQQFDPSGFFEKHKVCRNLLVKVVNWQFISVISLSDVSLADLEIADLSPLHSLTSLYLNISSIGKSSSDWKFLDVCRASLEYLDMSYYERIPGSLSCRTFRGMTKLKSLSLSGSLSVDKDDQEELFADLTQLEKLSIRLNNMPFVFSWKMFEKMASLKSLSLSGPFSIQPDNRDKNSPNLDQLKSLSINANTIPFPLSRKMFCTMTNLQELELSGAFSIETNNQEELFADLIHLKKLVLYMNEQMLTTKWFIHSPSVEQLRLTFDKSLRVASSQIRFKLPQLASLQLFFYCERIECDLTDMMSCFSHVKNLKITSRCYDIMTKGWFHRLTSVEELVLDLRCEGLINSQLFERFDHLTKLKIYLLRGQNLDPCALQKLAHLETITFINYEGKYKSLNGEDKSMFNGLNSLRTIEHFYGYPRYRSYVYFENLDRFILVVT